jgi:hypothetical protein
MNKEDIIRMAREAGGHFAELLNGDAWLFDGEKQLARFAALVAAAENEACAKVCDGYFGPDYDCVSDILAAAIRARGQS